MLVELFVSREDLIDGLFGWYFENVCMIGDHVDKFDGSGLFGEFTDDVLLVFPPLYFVVSFKMKILAVGTVELMKTCFDVDFDSGFACDRIKPKSDVSTCSFNERTGLRALDVLLYKFGKVVDLTEKNDPAVVGCVMLSDLCEGVKSLFGDGRWKILLDIVSVH
jgi:hypothetical protein